MSGYEPSQAFHNAAAFLSNAPSLAGLSNNAKLELYGLFKVVTVGATPNTSRPSIFDFTGRAKWDAWKETGQKYADHAQAEERYVELAKGLGWEPGIAPSALEKPQKDTGGEEDIWDNDETSHTKSKGSSGGMGNWVSTMDHTDEDERSEDTIHSFAIAGNDKGLRALLDANPSVDVNEVDEYGYTPLHLACDRGHATIAKLLLDRGADPNIKDSDDYTALELAEIAEHGGIVALVKAAAS